jgi:hypothetical protein
VRVGDSIVISRSEAELLKSASFAEVVPPQVAEKIRLEPEPSDAYRLELPKVGRPVVSALQEIARGRSRQAIIAEHLAEAIEQRLASR